MPEEVTADRVSAIAAAARVPLLADSVPRIARAVASTVTRLTAAKIDLPLETEPASFVVVQRREIGR